MTAKEIIDAVDRGLTVHWSNAGYTVRCGSVGHFIRHWATGSCIGLTWSDGKTLNGKEEDFYIGGEE